MCLHLSIHVLKPLQFRLQVTCTCAFLLSLFPCKALEAEAAQLEEEAPVSRTPDHPALYSPFRPPWSQDVRDEASLELDVSSLEHVGATEI